MLTNDFNQYQGLELSTLKDNEVLFFVRIHGKKGMFGTYYPNSVLKKFSSLEAFRTISEYAVGDVYIDLRKFPPHTLTSSDHDIINSCIDLNEVIMRCRALREISFGEARQLIWRAAKFFIDYYQRHGDLKLIVALIVDNYVMDIMVRLAEHFNIKVMGMVGFMVPGYMRITNYGPNNPVRTVPDQELEEVYQRLVAKKPSHFAIPKGRAYKNALRDYISYRYRYITRYIWGYKLRGDISYEYRFAPLFRGFHKLSKLFPSKYFSGIKQVNANAGDMFFIPLHFHPEATVDYWADSPKHADYLNSLIEVISFYKNKGKTVLLKEHPNYYLRRSVSFYKALKQFDNVYILDPFVTTQSVFDYVDNVVVYTGSAGVEALMADKNVFTVSENYYSNNQIPYYKNIDAPVRYSEEEKRNILNRVLTGTIKL